MNKSPWVITIDGAGGVGKGTISKMLAKELGWHFLDSGAIYRVLAYAALSQSVALDNEDQLATLALNLPLRFDEEGLVFWNDQEVTELIRSEACGDAASKVAAYPKVRTALLERQRAFRQWPGLVTDGRDMGTVVFPEATVKFFLQATVEERARRRFHQLKDKGINVSLCDILFDLEQRDKRDQARTVAPLKPAIDAEIIDTTQMNILQVFRHVLASVTQKLNKLGALGN